MGLDSKVAIEERREFLGSAGRVLFGIAMAPTLVSLLGSLGGCSGSSSSGGGLLPGRYANLISETDQRVIEGYIKELSSTGSYERTRSGFSAKIDGSDIAESLGLPGMGNLSSTIVEGENVLAALGETYFIYEELDETHRKLKFRLQFKGSDREDVNEKLFSFAKANIISDVGEPASNYGKSDFSWKCDGMSPITWLNIKYIRGGGFTGGRFIEYTLTAEAPGKK